MVYFPPIISIEMYDARREITIEDDGFELWSEDKLHLILNLFKVCIQYFYDANDVYNALGSFSIENIRHLTDEQCDDFNKALYGEKFVAIEKCVSRCFTYAAADGFTLEDEESFNKILSHLNLTQLHQLKFSLSGKQKELIEKTLNDRGSGLEKTRKAESEVDSDDEDDVTPSVPKADLPKPVPPKTDLPKVDKTDLPASRSHSEEIPDISDEPTVHIVVDGSLLVDSDAELEKLEQEYQSALAFKKREENAIKKLDFGYKIGSDNKEAAIKTADQILEYSINETTPPFTLATWLEKFSWKEDVNKAYLDLYKFLHLLSKEQCGQFYNQFIIKKNRSHDSNGILFAGSATIAASRYIVGLEAAFSNAAFPTEAQSAPKPVDPSLVQEAYVQTLLKNIYILGSENQKGARELAEILIKTSATETNSPFILATFIDQFDWKNNKDESLKELFQFLNLLTVEQRQEFYSQFIEKQHLVTQEIKDKKAVNPILISPELQGTKGIFSAFGLS